MSGGGGAGRTGAAGGAPAILAIGASTGGPQALTSLLARLAPMLRGETTFSLPVCVALHMPRDLMPLIAAHVSRRCAIAASVVDEPRPLRGGCVFFAPGDRHLGFECGGGEVVLRPLPSRPPSLVAQSLASPFCRQAGVDALFAGMAAGFGARGIAIVLSGMGEDGLAGSRRVVERGGVVLAQDRISSAVWGMPGAVVRAGLAARTLPPAALADEVFLRLARAGGGRLPSLAPHTPPPNPPPPRPVRGGRRAAEPRR